MSPVSYPARVRFRALAAVGLVVLAGCGGSDEGGLDGPDIGKAKTFELADFEPKGQVAQQYGMYLEERGHNERGFVVIDGEGKVKHSHKSPSPLEIPGANLIFDALAS